MGLTCAEESIESHSPNSVCYSHLYARKGLAKTLIIEGKEEQGKQKWEG